MHLASLVIGKVSNFLSSDIFATFIPPEVFQKVEIFFTALKIRSLAQRSTPGKNMCRHLSPRYFVNAVCDVET